MFFVKFWKSIKSLYLAFLKYVRLFLLYFDLFWLILTCFCVFYEYFVSVCKNMHKFNPENHYLFKNHLHFLKSYKIKSGAVRTFYTTQKDCFRHSSPNVRNNKRSVEVCSLQFLIRVSVNPLTLTTTTVI